jgi:DNA-binding NtrC family response regulator
MKDRDSMVLVIAEGELQDRLARAAVDAGLAVRLAADASEALSALTMSRIGLVLLDLRTPGPRHHSLFGAIRDKYEDLRVIVYDVNPNADRMWAVSQFPSTSYVAVTDEDAIRASLPARDPAAALIA